MRLVMMKKKQRESGLELLRLLAIFAIVMHHACINDSLVIFTDSFNLNHLVVSLLGIWGNFGVVLFFMLGFWFMLDEDYNFQVKKWIQLAVETSIFALCAITVAHIAFDYDISIKDLVKCILSPALGTFWYITSYLVVFLLLPFLRKMLICLPDEGLLALFGISTLVVPIYRGVFAGINQQFRLCNLYCDFNSYGEEILSMV